MSNLEFIRKLYNGRNCYSDHMSEEDLQLLHISSGVESLVVELVKTRRIVFLTGNPGDGKTFLIRSIASQLSACNAYVETDLNSVTDSERVAEEILTCYQTRRPAVIAVNEYPFIRLCRQLRALSPELYEELQRVRQNSIIYGAIQVTLNRIAVIDLNERNLLDSNHTLADELIDRICRLLQEDEPEDPWLCSNIKAMSVPEIRQQLVYLFHLASLSGEHFAVRDILGAIAFMLTACNSEEHPGLLYYDALFIGSNSLLSELQQYDPIYLTNASLDEALWNGEITEGWRLDTPGRWPNDPCYEDDVSEATELFKSIKRKYYFENTGGQALQALQPTEIEKCMELFTALDSRRRPIKESLIKAINKLFLPSSEDRKRLHIWTTHRYDQSIDVSAAVSSRYVDTDRLDLQMPQPAGWLKKLEYTPRYLVLKPRHMEEPALRMDVDFLRTMEAINAGYPVCLLAPHYAQTAARFLSQLSDSGLAEDNDDGKILIASRKRHLTRVIYIKDGQYDFEGEEDE